MAHTLYRRRRVLQIMAIGTGLALLGRRARAEIKSYVWRGIALGAPASITLYHADAALAQHALTQVEAELHRLEQEFSLYRPDSALCCLNRQGYLQAPSLHMLRLLGEAQAVSSLTAGAFDVSVQPLWTFYRDYFKAPSVSLPPPPDTNELAAALGLVDYRAIDIQSQRISLLKPGMALTLNGIAQGYITDRIADRLHSAGFTQVLLDLGEVRALGGYPDGRAWQIGLSDPTDKTHLIEQVPVRDQAVATSSGAGMRFDSAGRYHHLFDPRSGQCQSYYHSLSVIAPTATLADALATALYQMPYSEIASTLARFGSVSAIVHLASGVVKIIPARA